MIDEEGTGVPKPSRLHHSDEFGKSAPEAESGSRAATGFGRRSLGAPAAIAAAGRAENDSGVTPPPPSVPLRVLLVGLVVMFMVGIAVMVVLMRFGPRF
jgi:hypothetical protein